MRVAKVYLIIMAVMSVLFGVIYLVNPLSMTTPMGFGDLAPSALTDVRATYGGFQIATGLFMFYCLKPERIKTGVLLALLCIAGIALSRLYGFAVDRDITPTLKGTAIFEVTTLVISFVIWMRTPNSVAA